MAAGKTVRSKWFLVIIIGVIILELGYCVVHTSNGGIAGTWKPSSVYCEGEMFTYANYQRYYFGEVDPVLTIRKDGTWSIVSDEKYESGTWTSEGDGNYDFYGFSYGPMTGSLREGRLALSQIGRVIYWQK